VYGACIELRVGPRGRQVEPTLNRAQIEFSHTAQGPAKEGKTACAFTSSIQVMFLLAPP
jgi:hypothetical protein